MPRARRHTSAHACNGNVLYGQTCGPSELEGWSALRAELWNDGTLEEHRAEAAIALDDPTRLVAFLARDADGRAIGFAEASVRSDYVNGCSTSPVGFLEGLYVREDVRRQDIACRLVMAVEYWAREQGCMELASDALLANAPSQKVNRAIGFSETERVVFLRKSLQLPDLQ
jgi:aminoglycoside 6'-N-acetyltransferase I